MVETYKNPGKILSSYGSDWPVIVINPRKESNKWEWTARILVWEGTDIRVLGKFYNEEAHSIIIFEVILR